MEDILHGYDASRRRYISQLLTLALLAPEIAFRKINWVPDATKEELPNGEIYLGSIEFLWVRQGGNAAGLNG